jgi:uncharacterized protein involved in tolerance to divalent cations
VLLGMLVIHDRADAVRIADELLNRRLIAGYNLIAMDSAFWWKGETLRHPETLILLKSRKEEFEVVESAVKELSGYEVPELFAVEPTQVGEALRTWVRAEASTSQTSAT